MKKRLNTRLIAFNLLGRVIINKAYPDIVLNNYFKKNSDLKDSDINMITEMVYGTIRWKKKLIYILNQFLNHKLKSRKVELLLILGIYQLLMMHGIPDHASINETVNAAKELFDKKIKNLVNGVLRQVARNRENIEYPIKKDDITRYLSINYSYPKWLIDKWIDSYGDEITEDICINLNINSKSTIRVNENLIGREEFAGLISDYRPRYTEFSKAGLQIEDLYGLLQSQYFKKGYFSIQDESSQIVSILLDPKPGDIVLDACSAPGTKSNHIAEIMENRGRIISCDINKKRLNLVKRDAKRLKNTIIEAVCSDARDITFSPDIRFDKIVVDAPCSGLGTIKNNPDIKWNKSNEDITTLALVQYEILNNVSRFLKRGGTLVYSVCTLNRDENEGVCEKFLKHRTKFSLDGKDNNRNKKINRLLDRNGYFSSLGYLDQMDGFFIAKFQKK